MVLCIVIHVLPEYALDLVPGSGICLYQDKEKETLVQENQKSVMTIKVLKHFMTFVKKFKI